MTRTVICIPYNSEGGREKEKKGPFQISYREDQTTIAAIIPKTNPKIPISHLKSNPFMAGEDGVGDELPLAVPFASPVESMVSVPVAETIGRG